MDPIGEQEKDQTEDMDQVEEQEEELNTDLRSNLKEGIAACAKNVGTIHYFIAQS